METKKKILIAEDNASNFKLLDVILSKDFELLHAWNGKEAVAFSDDEQEGYDCGMTEYMTKPINIVQLRMHISKLLG